MVSYHDNTHSPVGHWKFDGDLLDSSGNGNDLALEPTVPAGIIRYSDVFPGLRGFHFNGGTGLYINSFVGSLAIAGDITVEALLVIERVLTIGNDQTICRFGDATGGEAQADNVQYFPHLRGRLFRWTHEHTGGVDQTYIISDGLIIGVPYHCAWRRENDVIQFFLNGRPIGAPSAALVSADGGANSIFRVGRAIPSNPSYFTGVMASLKIVSSALTDEQILAESDLTIGDRKLANKFDLTNNPVVLYQFEDDLTDASPNGFDLSLAAGVERYTELDPGVRGALLTTTTTLERAFEAALQIQGDMTILMLLVPELRTDTQLLLKFGFGADVEYQIELRDAARRPLWEQEAGGPNNHDSGGGLHTAQFYILGVTRTSGVIQFYLNGLPYGSASAALPAPDGGGGQTLQIGSNFQGGMASLKILDFALDAEGILEETNTVLGVTPEAEVFVFPADDTIRGGKLVQLASPSVTVLDETENQTFTAPVLPAGWTGVNATATPQGVLLATPEAAGSSASLTKDGALDHFDAQLTLAHLGPRGTATVSFTVGGQALQVELVAAANRAVFIRASTTSGLGDAVQTTLVGATTNVRLVRNDRRVWAFANGVKVLDLTNFVEGTGTYAVALTNGAARGRMQARLRDFVVETHARIGPRLLDNKQVAFRRVVGNVPAATLPEVGTTDIVIFGLFGEVVGENDFTYTLPLPRTVGREVSRQLLLVRDKQIRDGEE